MHVVSCSSTGYRGPSRVHVPSLRATSVVIWVCWIGGRVRAVASRGTGVSAFIGGASSVAVVALPVAGPGSVALCVGCPSSMVSATASNVFRRSFVSCSLAVMALDLAGSAAPGVCVDGFGGASSSAAGGGGARNLPVIPGLCIIRPVIPGATATAMSVVTGRRWV